MKNKFLKKLSDVFKSGCVIFTFVVFAFYLLGNAISSAVQVLTLTNLFLLLLFSVWFAASNNLLKNKKLNTIIKIVFHFISTMVGFFVIFVYLPGNLDNKSRAFILTLVFAAAYIIVAALILIIKGALNKKRNDDKDYDSIYDKTEDN